MINRDEAVQLIQSHLADVSASSGGEVALIESATLERPFGWVFFYQSKEYLETGQDNFALAGNAPLIVNRLTGQVLVTGTAEAIEDHIAGYEASL